MLLSIVIPTKNRCKELIRVLRIMDGFKNDFEIIVQDNSTESSAHKFGAFSHVKYYHSDKLLSVSENFDEGIKHSCGDYVICIGDDDCVCTNIFDAVSYMESHGIETCKYPLCHFLWDDVERSNPEEGQLRCVHREQKTEWRKIDAIRELETICKTSSFSLSRLPGVYHGIVSRVALERVYALAGSYFPSASPDISNAAALCVTAKENVFVNRTLSIAGCCADSAGGLGATKRHVRELHDVPWLPKNIDKVWDDRIPKIWTAETIWMFSMVDALNKCGYSVITDKIRWNIFYAAFLYRHRKLLRRLSISQIVKGCCGMPQFARICFAARKTDSGLKILDIRTIEDATNAIAKEFVL